ncbi:hypothetical protein BDP27DRAFT_1360868 [Rhodocollybia butyracea]|uniref:Uncharacterized protein n=1 Tax=Rhodocollybia butyracea TaxID=206335 RepID=A0A9P5UAY7_9AGAR|nr:hypothetical protein BDP27DRAFT_1360868 [Rhodocollybia butyracea]
MIPLWDLSLLLGPGYRCPQAQIQVYSRPGTIAQVFMSPKGLLATHTDIWETDIWIHESRCPKQHQTYPRNCAMHIAYPLSTLRISGSLIPVLLLAGCCIQDLACQAADTICLAHTLQSTVQCYYQMETLFILQSPKAGTVLPNWSRYSRETVIIHGDQWWSQSQAERLFNKCGVSIFPIENCQLLRGKSIGKVRSHQKKRKRRLSRKRTWKPATDAVSEPKIVILNVYYTTCSSRIWPNKRGFTLIQTGESNAWIEVVDNIFGNVKFWALQLACFNYLAPNNKHGPIQIEIVDSTFQQRSSRHHILLDCSYYIKYSTQED